MELYTIICSKSFFSVVSYFWIFFYLIYYYIIYFQTTPFLIISFYVVILYFIAESQLIFILIYQLLESLLVFKNNYSHDIFDKSYKILIFCKISKDINLKKALKLLLIFTPDTPDIFSKEQILMSRIWSFITL